MLETMSDRAVFQKLYQENARKLYFIAWQIVKNEAEAEAVVYTCFQNLSDDYTKYRHQKYADLEKLCCCIVKNVATDMAEKHTVSNLFSGNKVIGEEKTLNISQDMLKEQIEQNNEKLLAYALRKLEESDRNLLFMQYGLNMKPIEIGKLMNMTSKVAQKKLFICKNKLVTIMEGK